MVIRNSDGYFRVPAMGKWRTFELVLEPPAGSDRQRLKKLFEFNRTVAVLVENIEDEAKIKFHNE